MHKTSLSCLSGLLCLLTAVPLPAQLIPSPTDLPDKPFFIKSTWMIGGSGNWDFLKMDPSYSKLLVPHGNQIQSVDIETGKVDSAVHGLSDARSVAIDDRGQYGFVTEARQNQVAVFDRRSLQIVKQIDVALDPRAMAFDPASGLIFVVCGQPNGGTIGRSTMPSTSTPGARVALPIDPSLEWQRNQQQSINDAGAYAMPKPDSDNRRTQRANTANPIPPKPGTSPTTPAQTSTPTVESVLTVIDADKQTVVTQILLPGRAGFAETDSQGRIFINILDQNTVIRIDAQGIRSLWQNQPPPPPTDTSNVDHRPIPTLDWTGTTPGTKPPDALYSAYNLGSACLEPQGLAVDSKHLRLFVACRNVKMQVVNIDDGTIVATVPTGYGTSVIGYDPDRGLIFAANGDNGGTLTIIRQTVNDTYNVIQNLSTTYRAQVLAINPASGEVYLVTDAGQSQETPDQKKLRRSQFGQPSPSSFHVLVVGH